MTVQALSEVSICDEARPTTHAVLFKLWGVSVFDQAFLQLPCWTNHHVCSIDCGLGCVFGFYCSVHLTVFPAEGISYLSVLQGKRTTTWDDVVVFPISYYCT